MMNWTKTDEDKLLRTSAVQYFQKNLPIDHLRKMRDTQDCAGFSRASWKEMAELGWTGILIPEEFGGLNFGFRGLGLILEAAGRSLAATPLLSSVACAGRLIQMLGTVEQKSTYLGGLASGDMIIALAHDEGSRHSEPDVSLSARSQNMRHSLKGRKSMCLDAGIADHILVLARSFGGRKDPEGLSWFLVPSSTPGLEIESFRLVDGRPAAHIHFNDVDLPESALLGSLGDAYASYQDLRDAGAASLAAEMLGSATAAFEMTLAYLKERQQFGVPIGSFQALQHRMAALFCELELCSAAVQRCLGALDAGESDRSLACSLAKAKLSEVFHSIAAEAIQMHGGIGMTDEHDIGFFLKRSRISSELFGSASFHRDRYAQALNF